MICPAPFVSGKISLDEAIERLKEIHQFSFYPLPIRVFGYGLISGCCSFRIRHSFWMAALPLSCGLFLGCLDIWLGKKKIPYFFGPFLGGVAAACLACLIQPHFPSAHIGTIIIGSIMPLLRV